MLRTLVIVLALSSLSWVDCLTCLDCTDIESPRHCKHVTECPSGKECYMQKTISRYGELLFDLGCTDTATCSNRSHGTCDVCCSSDLCNAAGCGQQGYPSSRGPICYSCSGQTTEGICQRIEFCSSNEVCMLREEREFGDTVYTSQCATLTHCEKLKGDVAQIIGRSILEDTRSLTETTCHNCCHGDLCNAHCSSEVDYCASDPCVHGRCVNGMTGYTCVCDPTYHGHDCSEFNYCASSPCVHGRCANGMAGYTCVCDPMYYGHNCSEFNYCASSPCVHGRCVNGMTGYTCDCDQMYRGRNCSEHITFIDCLAVKTFTNVSGVYTINIGGSQQLVEVYCDMETDGGGWTVFQRRMNGTVNFDQNFTSYENGFGNVHGEFWLGLKNIYAMTYNARTELRIDVVAADGSTAYEVYPNFSLSAAPSYTLHIDRGHGTAGDDAGLSFINGQIFYTNVNEDPKGCARKFHAGWWFQDNCFYVNLNGQYLTPGTHSPEFGAGVVYYNLKTFESLKETTMMFRRV